MPGFVMVEHVTKARQATGGALRTDVWNRFVDELGFPEEQIA